MPTQNFNLAYLVIWAIAQKTYDRYHCKNNFIRLKEPQNRYPKETRHPLYNFPYTTHMLESTSTIHKSFGLDSKNLTCLNCITISKHGWPLIRHTQTCESVEIEQDLEKEV